MEFIVYISVCIVCKIKKSNERVEKKRFIKTFLDSFIINDRRIIEPHAVLLMESNGFFCIL